MLPYRIEVKCRLYPTATLVNPHTQISQLILLIPWLRHHLLLRLLLDPTPPPLFLLESALASDVVLAQLEERVADDWGEGEDEEEDATGAGEGWAWSVVGDVGHWFWKYEDTTM